MRIEVKVRKRVHIPVVIRVDLDIVSCGGDIVPRRYEIFRADLSVARP
jgi:hypothetical protein